MLSIQLQGHSQVPLDFILLSHTYSALNSCWLLQFVSISWPIGLYGDIHQLISSEGDVAATKDDMVKVPSDEYEMN